MEMYIDETVPVISEKIKTSRKGLMSFYWLILIAWLIVALDFLVLKGSIQQRLPKLPEEFIIFAILFNTPHIFASSLTFFDAEYLKYYKTRLLISFFLILISCIAIPQIFGYGLFATIFLTWTIIHVVGQQFGLCVMMTKVKSTDFMVWKWTGLPISVLIYLDVYLDIGNRFLLSKLMFYISLVLFIPFTITTITYSLKSKEQLGKIAVLSNYVLVLSAWTFFNINYSFFAILVPKVIHDFTAFSFYIAHDTNRNNNHSHNFLYGPLIKIGIPIIILGPMLAIGLSYTFTQYRGVTWLETLVISMYFFHYYTESFAWKKGSLHRRAISVN